MSEGTSPTRQAASSDRAATGVSGTSSIPERLAEIREKDKKRIAFDLHDGPAQALSRALLQVGIVETMLVSDELSRELTELRELLKGALGEIHSIMHELRPRSLESEGLVAKIRGLVEDATNRQDGNGRVALSIKGQEPPLSTSAQITLFRIAQEALSNALKHSGASHIEVLLAFTPREVYCSVNDNGTGFSVHDPVGRKSRSECFGLLGMRERAELLGGQVDIDSRPGNGARVTARIPVWKQP